jgi:phosphopantothenoylcysteine synthetase/decarboxylase
LPSVARENAVTVVLCGAGPTLRAERLVRLAQDRGLAVDIIATPAAAPFLAPGERTELCGAPIRFDYHPRAPGEPRPLPSRHPIIVAPATYNTTCKLALGISDNYALTTLAEALGAGRRVVLLPFVNEALARRRPFTNAVANLRAEGAIVLLGPGVWEPHPPGEGAGRVERFPWQTALDAAFPAEHAG